MAKIFFPRSFKLPDHIGMMRSIREGTRLWPYELKITLDDVEDAQKNLYIGLQDHDMKCILYHLKFLGLIEKYKDE